MGTHDQLQECTKKQHALTQRLLTPFESCLGNGFGFPVPLEACLDSAAGFFHDGSLTEDASEEVFLSGSLIEDSDESCEELLRMSEEPVAKVSDRGRRVFTKSKYKRKSFLALQSKLVIQFNRTPKQGMSFWPIITEADNPRGDHMDDHSAGKRTLHSLLSQSENAKFPPVHQVKSRWMRLRTRWMTILESTWRS